MGALGGYPARCNICHDYATVGEQSGPNFDSAIRVCEKCHGPESLHNIQADSDGDGLVVVGGELARYGHVGRDAGPGDPAADSGLPPSMVPLLMLVRGSRNPQAAGGLQVIELRATRPLRAFPFQPLLQVVINRTVASGLGCMGSSWII